MKQNKGKEDIKKIDKRIKEWYQELEKYTPADIVSDRIKSEINRLRNLRNEKEISIVSSKINSFYYISLILFLFFISSFFIKPKIIITFNILLTSAIIIFLLTICPIWLKHFLSKEDREAKRKRDLAETEYLQNQIKK